MGEVSERDRDEPQVFGQSAAKFAERADAGVARRAEMAKRRLCVRYADGEEEEWPILEDDARALQRRACARPRAQRRAAFVFRGLTARAFWDADAAGAPIARLRAALEARYAELAAEAAALLHAGLLAEREDALCWAPHSEGLHSGVWLKLALWGGGRVHDGTCARLPVTAALLRRLASAADSPIMLDAPGCACLSLMLPGANVAPHHGPTNHRRAFGLPARARARVGHTRARRAGCGYTYHYCSLSAGRGRSCASAASLTSGRRESA